MNKKEEFEWLTKKMSEIIDGGDADEFTSVRLKAIIFMLQSKHAQTTTSRRDKVNEVLQASKYVKDHDEATFKKVKELLESPITLF